MFFSDGVPLCSSAGVPQINGSAGPSSVNGIHTCKGEPSGRSGPPCSMKPESAAETKPNPTMSEKVGKLWLYNFPVMDNLKEKK